MVKQKISKVNQLNVEQCSPNSVNIREKNKIFIWLLLKPNPAQEIVFRPRSGRPWLSCLNKKRPEPPPKNQSTETGIILGILDTKDRYYIHHELSLLTPSKDSILMTWKCVRAIFVSNVKKGSAEYKRKNCIKS